MNQTTNDSHRNDVLQQADAGELRTIEGGRGIPRRIHDSAGDLVPVVLDGMLIYVFRSTAGTMQRVHGTRRF